MPQRSLMDGAVFALAAAGTALGVLVQPWKVADLNADPNAGGVASWVFLVLVAIAGFTSLAVGGLLHLRRPDNRLGLLLVLVGVGIFAEDLQYSSGAPVYTLGLLLARASTGPSVHVVLSFPTGRLVRRRDRSVVVAAYAVSLVAPLVSTMVLRTYQAENLLLVHEVWWLSRWVSDLGDALTAVLAVYALGVLARRWHRANAPQRSAYGPVLLVGLIGAVVTIGVSVPKSEHASDWWGAAYALVATAWPLTVAAGVVRVQLSRSPLTVLLDQLRRAGPDSDLRALVARALGDPTVELVYFDRGSGALVGDDGAPVAAEPSADRAVTRILRGDSMVGALLHDPAVLENPFVLDSVSGAVSLAIENQRLAAEIRGHLTEVQESRRRLLAAVAAERKRMERDLHDGAQQLLVSAMLELQLADQELEQHHPAAGQLKRGAMSLRRALASLRDLSHGIYPIALNEAGLVEAVRDLVDSVAIPMHVQAEAVPRLPDEVEMTAYFVIVEAVTNAMKHSGAQEVFVTIDYDPQTLRVRVTDTGRGGAQPEGSGLAGLADRVAAIRGDLAVSSEQGAGTTLTMTVPLEDE